MVRKEFSRYLVSFIKPKFKILSNFLVISLLFGSFLVPARAGANILTNLFGGNNASASTDTTDEINPEINSQNMGLLEAKVSQSKDKTQDDSTLSSQNALVPASSPSGVSDGTDEDISSDQISVYVVRSGDSIASIAKMYDVSSKTIIWANGLKAGEKLTEGERLIILPVSGVQHSVKKGETLASIAKKYKVDVSDIAGFNAISEDATLSAGDELIIPDGEIIDNGGSSSSKTAQKDPNYYKKYPKTNLGGYFINPVPEYRRKSQGLHGGPRRNAVDLAAPVGTPIVAAASGTVIFARNGYNGGYGNMVIISHPNGTETLYAHMSKIATSAGSQVSQGEIIGYVGSTGHSTGPHLHYEVHGAVNNANSL